MPLDSSSVLGLFAKHPLPGFVKSRLAGETSAEWATGVAEAFLFDLTDRLRQVLAHKVLVYAPADAKAYFTELAGKEFQSTVQCDGDLGTRMSHFVQSQFLNDKRSVVLVGMDSLTIPLSFIEDSFDALTAFDVVIGPATDGGYYLIGYRRWIPELFQNISWGKESVLAETIHRCQSVGATLRVLPPWYDVDTLADWRMLQGHLAALQLAGQPVELPRTAKLADWPST